MNYDHEGGKYRNDSEIWTEKLLKECNHVIQDDGIFFLTLDEFMKAMRGIEMSKINPNYQYTSLGFTKEDLS